MSLWFISSVLRCKSDETHEFKTWAQIRSNSFCWLLLVLKFNGCGNMPLKGRLRFISAKIASHESVVALRKSATVCPRTRTFCCASVVVRQNSVLYPLLFNLYDNRLCKVVSNCQIYQYADDNVLLSRHIYYADAVNLRLHDSLNRNNLLRYNWIEVD